MPAIPSPLSEWLTLLTQPAVILLGVGLYVNLQNKRIDDLNKRIDDLREDVKDGLARLETRQREELKAMENRQREELKAMENRQREELKAMENRQRENMDQIKADNKALNEKLDRLLEARFSNQPVVAPDR